MDIEKETETEITLNGDYSVDVYVNGEFEWDLATTATAEDETRIRIVEQHEPE